jgi:hypothetical protein
VLTLTLTLTMTLKFLLLIQKLGLVTRLAIRAVAHLAMVLVTWPVTHLASRPATRPVTRAVTRLATGLTLLVARLTPVLPLLRLTLATMPTLTLSRMPMPARAQRLMPVLKATFPMPSTHPRPIPNPPRNLRTRPLPL